MDITCDKLINQSIKSILKNIFYLNLLTKKIVKI